ncbi:DoxX-like protein [Roseimicrobium gellanilyticum]|uniref:DoxX-like protein n=1 Tax=Roseimicrobium gellanilyticum TaxID=748857 RepID=A0A366HBF9_9BACT|nr:DoxX-like family protein [Roseimicrobium gellanilyticum]RBP39597.1 DoxX-like protein [Roseimicrobium gellanilyticum]
MNTNAIAATAMNAAPDTDAPTHHLTSGEWKALHRIKVAARLSIGLVWVWEGLMPKMLFPNATQFEMVRRSGWWVGSPEETLWWLGAAMVVAGIAIMSGIWERAAALVSTLAVLVLMVLVIGTNPEALHDPFGGLVKDACLFTCAALVWWWPKALGR